MHIVRINFEAPSDTRRKLERLAEKLSTQRHKMTKKLLGLEALDLLFKKYEVGGKEAKRRKANK